jgi:hypothetical protein
MKIIIVSHYKRADWVRKLLEVFPGAFVVTDYLGRGALWAHTEAINIAAMLGERCIIMEDDAIPVANFEDLAARWIHWHPDDFISFYLGTGRPVEWQDWVTDAIAQAGTIYSESDGWIAMSRLLHGVCYTFPPDQAQRIADGLRRLNGRTPAADVAVGKAWGNHIVYTVQSLVEHRDQGSVEQHPDGQPRTEARVARFLAGPLAYDR